MATTIEYLVLSSTMALASRAGYPIQFGPQSFPAGNLFPGTMNESARLLCRLIEEITPSQWLVITSTNHESELFGSLFFLRGNRTRHEFHVARIIVSYCD